MLKVMSRLVFSLVVVLGFGIAAFAQSSPEEQRRAQIAQLEQQLQELRDQIEDSEPGTDQNLRVQEYLYKALTLVYSAKVFANSRYGAEVKRTQDLEALVEAGYLTNWPANPLDNWAPMRVLSTADGFYPGAFCVDYCPPHYYTDVGNGPEALSFQLYVYGQEPSLGSFQDVTVLMWNKRWVTVPADVLYGLSFTMQPEWWGTEDS